jgi:phosphohistidine phosphatase SixA
MTKIMIIRHAEKPTPDGAYRGVSPGGAHDKHDLSVRGWQRAGALVRFFAPHRGHPDLPIATPRSIFASAATHDSPSLRAKHTVTPLAEALRLVIHAHLPEGEEERVAATVMRAPNPVLIAWHHHHIPQLVQAIAGPVAGCPADWPDERFDLVWILEHVDGAWTFAQCFQRLLPDDLAEPV